MSFAFEKFGIPQFSGKDFPNFKFRVEIILEQQECRKAIDCSPVSSIDMKANRKAKAIIVACLGDNMLELVKGRAEAYEMWESLKRQYEQSDLAVQIMLRKKLLALRYDGKSNLEDYLLKFYEVIRDIRIRPATVMSLSCGIDV